MLLANGGARRILVQLAAGVLLAAWTLLGNLGGVCAQPQPTPERWGVRPFAEEEPEYKEKVAQLEREIHQVQSRLNQTRNNLEALWAEWSVDDKTWAEHQFFATPHRYGGALGGGLSLAKEEWDRAIGTYETVMAGAGRVDLRDPLVGPEVRDQVWSAHLRVLRRQLEYFNTALGYENIRYIAIKEQQQYRIGELNAFVNDAIDHIEYVYWSHVDAVMTELFNCMAKSTANAVRNSLLNQWGRYKDFMRVGQPDIPEPLYSAPAGTPNGWNVIWTTDPVNDRVPLGDAFFLDCIRDGFRAGLVSAVVSGMRKSFVDRVAYRDNVHPQIAEYWWSRFIWDGPIEDPYTHLALELGPGSGRPHYVLRKLEDAFWKNWGTGQPYKEQAIEQLKELIGARQTGKLAPVYKEATDAAKAAYDNAVRRGAIRPERMAELKRVSDKAANDIYKRKAPGIGAKAAVEVAENVITIGFQVEAAIELLWKEFSFKQQEQVLVKTHNEILQCLTKMEMSTGPAQIIAIYELGRNGRQGIDDFFRQCREPTRAQRERTMEQLREIDRQISVLLDEAAAQSTLARTQCDAALTACSEAARGYIATADSADQQKRARATAESELAALQSRITALDRQAEQAAQDGQAMGQAMVGAEQAALSACEVLNGFPSLKTDAERQGQLAVMRQGAARAGAEQRICRDRGSALRSLTGQIRAEAAAVAAEADAVAAASGPGAGDTASADADLERCRGSLGAARNAANALPALEQEALQLHSQAEAVARPMRGNQEIEGQMDTLWRHVEPITIAGRGPGECLPRAAQQLAAAEAAQGRAQRALADAGAAPTATGSPAAIKQAAEAAARKAENAGTFADDYLGRADVAAADAQNCVALAEDLARKAATSAATTSGTSAESASPAPAAGSGNVELANRSPAELRDLAEPSRAPSSGFQVGATQAGPADLPAATRGGTSGPDVAAPGAASPPAPRDGGGFKIGPATASRDPAQPLPAGSAPASSGFVIGPTTAGRDPAQPSPAGGAPASSGQGTQPATPAPGTAPPAALQTRAVAGQPAAFHIFATGSRMGWAAGLGQYSLGPADATIVEHLQVAGEHIMWANRESYLPVKAWPNWTANRAEVRSWADELAREPRNPTRRQITIRANSRAATLADELRYQTVGSPQYTATCDAAYMRLGYELGYGQQVLGIADEAARNGDRALAQKARQDGASHLHNAIRILAEYERTLHVTGRCADLRDVRAQLDAIFRLDSIDFAAQSRAATAAWQLALERIVALRGAQPAPVPPPPTQAVPPPAQAGGQPATRSQSADPQELEGTWFECWRGQSTLVPDRPDDLPRIARCLEEGQRDRASGLLRGGLKVDFEKKGDRYAGADAGANQRPWSLRDNFRGRAMSYLRSAELFRLTRVAPGTYEGEVLDGRSPCVPGGCSPGWFRTRIVVDGDVAREFYDGQGRNVLIYWVREPRRNLPPAQAQPPPAPAPPAAPIRLNPDGIQGGNWTANLGKTQLKIWKEGDIYLGSMSGEQELLYYHFKPNDVCLRLRYIGERSDGKLIFSGQFQKMPSGLRADYVWVDITFFYYSELGKERLDTHPGGPGTNFRR